MNGKGTVKLLVDNDIQTGDLVQITVKRINLPYSRENSTRKIKGTLMGIGGNSPDDILTIKLVNGYNINIKFDRVVDVDLLRRSSEQVLFSKNNTKTEGLPHVRLISTGGTIASKVDYDTGAVKPAVSGNDFIDIMPDLGSICCLDTLILKSKLSEDISIEDWMDIGSAVVEAFKDGSEGVVISHGTDTLAYTASALSFLLKDLPGPVVLVGSQRSSDRPSSDARMNLIDAVTVSARADISGVFVVMHGSISDDFSLIHRGTRVRKMHSSRRDAFMSINVTPVGIVRDGKIILRKSTGHRDPDMIPSLQGGFDPGVLFLNAYPSLDPGILEAAVMNSRCIVIGGTGLGHVSSRLLPVLKRMIEIGKPVIITTSCINGRTNLNVYSTGRELMNIGVIEAGDMIPETAYIKAMWTLKTMEVVDIDMIHFKELFLKSIAGESDGRTENGSFGPAYYHLLESWREG